MAWNSPFLVKNLRSWKQKFRAFFRQFFWRKSTLRLSAVCQISRRVRIHASFQCRSYSTLSQFTISKSEHFYLLDTRWPLYHKVLKYHFLTQKIENFRQNSWFWNFFIFNFFVDRFQPKTDYKVSILSQISRRLRIWPSFSEKPYEGPSKIEIAEVQKGDGFDIKWSIFHEGLLQK